MKLPDPRNKKIIILLGDAIFLYVSLILTLFIRYGTIEKNILTSHIFSFSAVYFLWLLIFYAFGLYDFWVVRSNLSLFQAALPAFGLNLLLAVAVFYIRAPASQISPKTNLIINAFIFLILFYFWRNLFKKIVKIAPTRKISIVGKNKESEEIIKIIKENPQLGYELDKTVEKPENLSNVIEELKNQIIVGDFNLEKNPLIGKNFVSYVSSGMNFINLAIFYEHLTRKVPISLINHSWFLENLTKKNSYEFFKRFIDFSLLLPSGFLFLISLPFVALAIKLSDNGKLFFKQKRVGKNGQIFNVWKYRTMIENAEANGAVWAKENDPRITKIGKFLRKTRIDELPQVINVFKGEMSFVGPRPERPEFVENLKNQIPFYDIRHLVKPGLTGWAQINFRYGASVEDSLEKLQYDIYYMKQRSIIMDLAIVAKTVKTLITAGGR